MVIGSNVEEQMAPYEHSDDKPNLSGPLYCFYWEVGPGRHTVEIDWRDAFKLKDGHQGEARFICGDEPAGLTYSAAKDSIDFEGMRRETESGAGQIWDLAQELTIPEWKRQIAPYSDPRRVLFSDHLNTLIESTYPDIEDYRFAYLNFVNEERLFYPRERYVDLCFKSRIAQGYLIAAGRALFWGDLPEIANIGDPLVRWDAWSDHVAAFIGKLPGDTLISKLLLKQ